MPVYEMKDYHYVDKKLKRWKYDCSIPRKMAGVYGYPKTHAFYKQSPKWERCE